jgi:hypothetical protein
MKRPFYKHKNYKNAILKIKNIIIFKIIVKYFNL